MKRKHLGEFEELVLLLVAMQKGEAYGISVLEGLKEEAKREVNISAVHAALRRLEEKTFIESKWSEATSERGGRRKRLYEITQKGAHALRDVQEVRHRLWNKLPDLGFDMAFA
ncbi:MAG: PadR family transcriptional regulator [Bacteroidia bacterium]